MSLDIKLRNKKSKRCVGLWWQKAKAKTSNWSDFSTPLWQCLCAFLDALNLPLVHI